MHNPFTNDSLFFLGRKWLSPIDLAIPVWFGGGAIQRFTESSDAENRPLTDSLESATRHRERIIGSSRPAALVKTTTSKWRVHRFVAGGMSDRLVTSAKSLLSARAATPSVPRQ